MSDQLVGQLQEKAIPVQPSCRVLEVSRSAYYEVRHRAAKPVLCKSSVHLKAAFIASHQRYGSRRLVTAMITQGHSDWPPQDASADAPATSTKLCWTSTASFAA